MHSVNYVGNNDVTLLESGTALFPAVIAALDAAQQDIHFETYIFACDATAVSIQQALMRAAGRGVKVRVVTDWFGTGHKQSKALGVAFRAAGVHFRVFNPWFRRGVTRTHRKIVVVDRRVAFVGGINVNDDMLCDYAPHEPLPAPRWDFAVEVRGPLVTQIHREAQAQWARVGHLGIVKRVNLFRQLREHPRAPGLEPMQAGLVVRDNLRNRRTIQRAYLQALGRARSRVLLANPYFAPGRKFREALSHAAGRGVDVTLLIGVGEFWLQDMVARSFYPKLLDSGIKVVEYRKTQLHAKVAVIDDDWSTVGSSNCDGLSLFLNQEANVVVKDAEFARSMRQHIERGIADGVEIHRDHFKHVGRFKRFGYETAYFLYRVTMRIFTIGYA
ncbi:cardiolipin synthase ClsB [Massilia eurypsychrophila]|jgi:cardiolipin synthase|uniref:Cardiolipin synthase B n=1 Tax=Massilia eurypsychrophila TaxID=1485217 RepID=A0A2G8TDK6_9BURK|nr:cardiolipin synthase ClsB [Massilia eurypsychrophila]PIL44145.1 cardiolipin synthase ClsB [Massilia eurypsychrophila]